MSDARHENRRKKDVGEMLHILYRDISKKDQLKNARTNSGEIVKIDTIINAAKPTLMGSTQGVDGAIHAMVDELLRQKYAGQDNIPTFNDMIRSELNVKGSKNQILCPRGHAVITGGYELCDYVIHVVGARYDIQVGEGKCSSIMEKCMRQFEICSSSSIRKLESCYYEIGKILRKKPDIRNIAIPIISSGEYGFPFKMAVKIAVASMGNVLLEWQREDEESFDSSTEWIQNIYFFIWNRDGDECKAAERILSKYKRIFSSGQQVVWQNSSQSQLQYFTEIIKYDKNRGYFCIARMVRILLAVLRFFSVYTYIKDLGGVRQFGAGYIAGGNPVW